MPATKVRRHPELSGTQSNFLWPEGSLVRPGSPGCRLRAGTASGPPCDRQGGQELVRALRSMCIELTYPTKRSTGKNHPAPPTPPGWTQTPTTFKGPGHTERTRNKRAPARPVPLGKKSKLSLRVCSQESGVQGRLQSRKGVETPVHKPSNACIYLPSKFWRPEP